MSDATPDPDAAPVAALAVAFDTEASGKLKRRADEEADAQPVEKKAAIEDAEGRQKDDTPRQKWGVLLQKVMLFLFKKHSSSQPRPKVMLHASACAWVV